MGELIITEYPVLDARYANGLKYDGYRELRKALQEKYGVCYWCKIPVKDFVFRVSCAPDNDMATIDHLVARPFRGKGEVVGKVLACWGCNIWRSKQQAKDANKYRRKQNPTHYNK